VTLCPFATHRLLPESTTQPHITPRIAILHSAAGRGSLYGWFKDNSSLESHFWVSDEGLIEQYMDTNRRADANRNANAYAVSIETESSPQATERWTPAQAAAITRLLDWLCREHPDIERQQCDRPDGSGIGWHTMWGSPSPWTPVAKSCPGPARIPQARDEIIPAVIAAGSPSEPKEWSDMATEAEVKAAVKAGVKEALAEEAKNKTKGSLGYMLRGISRAVLDPVEPKEGSKPNAFQQLREQGRQIKSAIGNKG